jgi:hypothetical protein
VSSSSGVSFLSEKSSAKSSGTGRSASAVKKAVKKVGNARKRVEKRGAALAGHASAPA